MTCTDRKLLIGDHIIGNIVMMQMELIIEQINTNLSCIILVKDLICNLINTFSIETSKIQILSLSTIDISQKKYIYIYIIPIFYIYIYTHTHLVKKEKALIVFLPFQAI